MVNATISSGPKAVYVPITPCRLADTRPGLDNVGTKNTPLGSSAMHTFTVRGTNGECTIPAGASAIVTNVTAVQPTASSFMTVWPADKPQPLASSLNYTAGQAPFPNAVTVTLSADGKINVYNHRGSVDVIIDIAGYYEDHHHDDRYYTKGQTDGALAQKASTADLDAVAAAGKWISIDPFAMNRRDGAAISAGFGANAGVTLPGGPTDLPKFEFGFTVPPDHTPNTPMTIEITWRINQTACTVALLSNYTSIARPGSGFRNTGLGNTSNVVPATPNTVTTSAFPLSAADFGLRPGDAVLLGFFRSFNNDTCSEAVFIQGIRVLYS
jgi:hypothetical protein